MDHPFSPEEVDTVLKDLRADHAPGLDGFNVVFIKKFWHIIKPVFARILLQDP
jgi:hypothetical protein